MPSIRYKILVNGEVKHTDLSFGMAIDYILKYINEYTNVTIEKYHKW